MSHPNRVADGGCRQLKIETQNVNAAACFYARHGSMLVAVNRGAYPRLPDEVQLLAQRSHSTGTGGGMKIIQNHYVLAVHNARESARFYADVLGFRVVHDDPSWVFVARDGCMIMLGQCPDDVHPSKLGCHNYFGYLLVDDVDALHAEWQAKGLRSNAPVADKPWGMREFGITTPDGHRITVGQKK
jgi:catechol 2,3-dioxygenase-like lactoylglutathione lyase family enzyme